MTFPKSTLFIKINCILFIFATQSAAFDYPDRSSPYTSIRQEQYQKNGVLVSRPNRVDLRIVDLIYLNNITSIEDYSHWLQKNIIYKQDNIQQWANPLETLKNKWGDCEDYALLNAAVVQLLGYKPRFLALLRSGGNAHAICTFKQDGYYVWFDNSELKRSSATSLEDFAQFITTQYNYSYTLELNLKTKNWVILYKKS